MSNFWRGFFWPFLLFALVFCVLARRGETSIITAALAGGCLGSLLAIGMAVFLGLDAYNIPWQAAKNWRRWPAPVRSWLARNLLGIGIAVALCVAGAFFV